MEGRYNRHMHKHQPDYRDLRGGYGYANLMLENQMHLHRKAILLDNLYQNFIENIRDDLNEGKKESEKGGNKENNQ